MMRQRAIKDVTGFQNEVFAGQRLLSLKLLSRRQAMVFGGFPCHLGINE